MKLDKFGRFVDIWDIILNLVKPVKEPVKLPPMRLVERLPNGSWFVTLVRDGVEGKCTGFGYNDTYDKALLDLEKKEGG